MEQFQKKFIEEATDLINELEASLMTLSSNPQDKEVVERIFRALHTIKGSSDMFGFHKIDEYTHHLETIYDEIRNGILDINDQIINITLASVDHLRNLLDAGNDINTELQGQHDELLNRIKTITHHSPDEQNNPDQVKTVQQTEISNTEKPFYHVYLHPNREIFRDGTNLLYLIDELYSIGECMAFIRFDKLPSLDKFVSGDNYLYWDIFIATDKGMDAIIDVFIFVDDRCEIEINKIAEHNLFNNEKMINYIKDMAGKTDHFNVKTLQEEANRHIHQIQKEVTTDDGAMVPTPSKVSDNTQSNKNNAITSIRVASDKLDELINLVSELVTTQARLSLFAEDSENAELAVIAENVEKISRRLRDNAFNIRLIPIENMLTRFQRLVRELSQEFNKEIVFKTKGAETELDKTIIESLSDPLMHIFRNSIDHGIESPEQREKAGKTRYGTILLKAYYSGTNVHIEIQDDGAGIDVEKIRKNAIAKNLIDPDVEISEREILNLIFKAGFTTAESVTSISGRGVGMDVVRRKISDIRGEIEIQTELGKGTNIIIKLPLTLSIIDGLLVTVDETFYIIPLASIDKCFEFKHEELETSVNNLIKADDVFVPYLYLRDLFEIKNKPPDIEQVVVVDYNDLQIGIAVDKIIGEYQAVLKAMSRFYKDQDFISGSTILGDGTVALVLDSNKIINTFSEQIKQI